jgi:hypothetical protein
VRRRVRTAALVVLVVVLLGTAAIVGVRWWRDRDRSDFEEAASYAPGDAERLSWTDWAAVREQVGTDLDARSSGSDVQSFLDQAFDADLSSASALVQSAPEMQERFGFSPATARWELFSQSEAGAVVIVRVSDEVDLDAVADDLEEAGYDRPTSADGVWIGADAVPEAGGSLTPELQYVVLEPDHDLVLTSDRPDYLRDVVAALGEDDLPDDLPEVVAGSGEPLSAVVYDGPLACSTLAMSHADAADQESADRLVAETGGVDPMTAYAMSVQPGGEVRAVMSFDSDDQARANAESRGALAAGPAPGQGGDFTDRFALVSASAEDGLVTLELDPVRGSYVFSDLSSGPVLFATC